MSTYIAVTRGDGNRQFIVLVDILRIAVQWCPVRTGCICILRTIGSEINKQCRATRPVLIDRNSFWISPSFCLTTAPNSSFSSDRMSRGHFHLFPFWNFYHVSSSLKQVSFLWKAKSLVRSFDIFLYVIIYSSLSCFYFSLIDFQINSLTLIFIVFHF